MNKRNILLFIFTSINLWHSINSEQEKMIYKCGKNELKIKPTILKNGISIDQNNPLYQRRLDSNGFKDFNIYLDLTNIEKGIIENNLIKYRNLFLNSFQKAIKTLESLLKVKPLKNKYYIEHQTIREMGIDYWDTSKFGDIAGSKGITTYSLGIDLIIFGKFLSQTLIGESVLASSSAYHYEAETGLPITGLLYINKDLDYSMLQSQEYFESIILHEFTHVLGFDIFFFKNVYKNYLTQTDKFGIQRHYIISQKVKNYAQKYFNCNNIIGVELEEYGNSGTAGSHWEARVLLGEYMNGYIYTEEQVISEFTLSLLEDTGLYKANYYTGGLMRYGKNKGCDFLY